MYVSRRRNYHTPHTATALTDPSRHGAHACLGREVLLEHVGRVQHVELLGGVLASTKGARG